MDELDEPIQIELRTEREVISLMLSLGVGAEVLLADGHVKGMAVCSNLQIRIAKSDPELLQEVLESYSAGGFLAGEGTMSNEAALAHLLDAEESDPEEVTRGSL